MRLRTDFSTAALEALAALAVGFQLYRAGIAADVLNPNGIYTRSGVPRAGTTSSNAPLGIVPVPCAPGAPSSSNCNVSRTTFRITTHSINLHLVGAGEQLDEF
jgi:hypothetical protein